MLRALRVTRVLEVMNTNGMKSKPCDEDIPVECWSEDVQAPEGQADVHLALEPG